MKRASPLLVVILLLMNATMFFSDFLPYNTLLKSLVVLGLIFNLTRYANARLMIDHSLQGYVLFTICVLLNLTVGGDTEYIITFLLNTIILILLVSTPGYAAIQYKMLFVCATVHFVLSMFVWLAPVSVTNALFRFILGNGYDTNYDWRIQQQMNPGITSQPGLNAMYLLCFFFACFVAYMVTKKYRKMYLIGCLLAMLMIITTGKRSSILLSVIGVACILFILRDKKISARKMLGKVSAVIMIVVFAIFVFSRTNIFDTIRNKMELLMMAGNLSNGRFALWEGAWEAFQGQPLFGIGLKSIYAQRGLDVHNTYIQILAEMGLIGFLLFIFALINIVISSVKKTIWLWRNTDRRFDKPAIYGMAMIIFLMLYGVVGNSFIDYLPLSTFVTAYAMVNENYRMQRRTRIVSLDIQRSDEK